MAQLSLRERLQPALFDRLLDDERLITLYELSFRRAELRRLGIAERELTAILAAQGLRAAEEPEAASEETLRLIFTAPAGRVSLSHLKALVLKPPGLPRDNAAKSGVALQTLCEIAARNVVNDSVESGELKSVSMRKLREYVCRDLAALLNCASLDAVVDLSAHPHVQSSVLNFGMPSLSGRSARSVDPQQIAATIEAAVKRFEPRLSAVRVAPEVGEDGNETHVLAFRIDAQLWGQPLPQQLVLRTSIDVDSGNVTLADSGST
jgi:type VI secretion system protein ImpF